MRIMVATKNKAKLQAVKEILADYPHLKDATVEALDIPSGVSEQPLSLEEIMQGAVNRARSVYSAGVDYGIGIESGFMPVPLSKSGYMNICACAIFDGRIFHSGLSSGFETPDVEIMRLTANKGMSFDQAANHTGFTNDKDIGKNDGIIGVLTKGKVNRKEYTKEAIRTALIHIDP
jgi:inosine/xanthosine triphosphatase